MNLEGSDPLCDNSEKKRANRTQNIDAVTTITFPILPIQISDKSSLENYCLVFKREIRSREVSIAPKFPKLKIFPNGYKILQNSLKLSQIAQNL